MILFTHTSSTFIKQHVLEHLSDCDVLTGLLITNKQAKHWLHPYHLKRSFPAKCIDKYTSQNRSLSAIKTSIYDVHTIKSIARFTALKKIRLSKGFNSPLKPGWCASRITHLDLGRQFNQALEVGSIPDSVQYLKFSERYNQPIVADVLPSSITQLEFDEESHFNQWLCRGSIPDSVRHLTLGINYQKPIDADILPDSITHLKFGRLYKPEIQPGAIPRSVTCLGLATGYPILAAAIPDSVTDLQLAITGECDDFLTPGCLPHSIRKLELSSSHFIMRGPIRLSVGCIPRSVIELKFDQDLFFQAVAGMIPNSVTHLCWQSHSAVAASVIPDSVRWLEFGYCIDNLIEIGHIPNSVQHLRLGLQLDKQTSPWQNRLPSRAAIPTSVTNLQLYCDFDTPYPPGIIPNTVTDLTVDAGCFNDRCKHHDGDDIEPVSMPVSVTHVTFRGFQSPYMILSRPVAAFAVPNTITHLTFDTGVFDPIPVGLIPSSVIHLMFGPKFNQRILACSIPTSVTHLTINYTYNREATLYMHKTKYRDDVSMIDFPVDKSPLREGSIPNSVTHLVFGENFTNKLLLRHIPESVQCLTIRRDSTASRKVWSAWFLRSAELLSQRDLSH